MILVISANEDDHARAVLEGLVRTRAAVTLLNLAQFPQHSQLAMNFSNVGGSCINSTISYADGNLALSVCEVVWWRRPQPFNLHHEITSDIYRSFAQTECYSAISGLWLTLDTFWVNHPTRDEEASRKAYQLKVAREAGFNIPATLITNSPEKARAFVERYGYDRTVYKSFSATEHAWRETRVLKSNEVELLDSVCYAPVIFQEYVPAHLDLRITIVGEEVFPVAIYSQDTNYKMDYRMEMDRARVEVFKLPDEVMEHLHAFMRRLGLVYGAIDMRLTPEGQFVFLEINPSGQWLFMERRTGLPITSTFVHLLSSHDKPPNKGMERGAL
jgi:hypothetical protein